jgi:hypothetical protein
MLKLTDFQTLKGNTFSLWYHSCIHNLQNKMHNFRINNEIPNDKICLCAQLRIIWVCIRVLVWVHVVHFVQIDAFTVFVSVLWCPLWLPGECNIRLFYSIVLSLMLFVNIYVNWCSTPFLQQIGSFCSNTTVATLRF